MHSLKQIAQRSAGFALIAVGIPIFLLPIPVGIFILGAGALLLVRSWPRARFARIRLRRRYPAFFKNADAAAEKISRRFRSLRASH